MVDLKLNTLFSKNYLKKEPSTILPKKIIRSWLLVTVFLQSQRWCVSKTKRSNSTLQNSTFHRFEKLLSVDGFLSTRSEATKFMWVGSEVQEGYWRPKARSSLEISFEYIKHVTRRADGPSFIWSIELYIVSRQHML